AGMRTARPSRTTGSRPSACGGSSARAPANPRRLGGQSGDLRPPEGFGALGSFGSVLAMVIGFRGDGPGPCGYSNAAAGSGSAGRESASAGPVREAFGHRQLLPSSIDRLFVALLSLSRDHRVDLGFEPRDFVFAQLNRSGELAGLYQFSDMITTMRYPFLR